MSNARELLLLDTNVVLHVVRGNEIGRRVDSLFHIRHRADRPLISIVSIAATAAAASAHLITTDADFDPLHPHHVRRTYVPSSLN